MSTFVLCGCYSDVDKFDMCGLGTQLYASHQEKSTIEDRLHFFTEECDNLQVFLEYVTAGRNVQY